MSLEDRLESGLPSAWRPDQEDPDTLIGEVVEIEVGTSDYGRYPIIVVKTETGEKAVHGFHSVLQNELMKHRPQVGEKVGIKYLGDVETKPGSKYKSYKGYRVKVDRERGAAFDWGSLGDAQEDQSGHIVYEQVQEQPVTVPAGAGEDDIPF